MKATKKTFRICYFREKAKRKELEKVLKIIKEKHATFAFVMDCDVHTYEDYLDILASYNFSLLRKNKYTETEFNKLKEYFK